MIHFVHITLSLVAQKPSANVANECGILDASERLHQVFAASARLLPETSHYFSVNNVNYNPTYLPLSPLRNAIVPPFFLGDITIIFHNVYLICLKQRSSSGFKISVSLTACPLQHYFSISPFSIGWES